MIANYFLMLSALLLFSGLALDAGLLEWKGMMLQDAADSAAQEGMYELARKNASWAAAGQAQSGKNGFTNGVGGVTVTLTNPPGSGNFATDSDAIQATVTQTASTFFMELANFGQAKLTRQATARIFPTCGWIMNPTGVVAPLWLLSTVMQSSSCGVYVNTATGNNMAVDYFSRLSDTRTRVFGPATGNQSTGTVSPAAQFGAAQKNDPLAYVAAPVFSSCNVTNTTVTGGVYTAYPATYCGGLTINNATVNMYPGLYVVTGGLTINNCDFYGTGVTFYFTQGGGYSFGTVNISNSTFHGVTAPTSSSGGGIEGVFLFMDRTNVNHGGQSLYINNSTMQTDGVWYLPNTGVKIQTSTLSGTNYLGLVIDNIYQYSGSTTLSSVYTTLAHGSPYHYDDGVLVQ